jgi:hypothetical protein
MLNSFFINGTYSEQGLIQDLINEQLKMYGIEVYYMPRQVFSETKIIKEVVFSKFKNAFPIEAYLLNYEGFDSNSIGLSKFGIRIADEMQLIISKERFELYISELMKVVPNIKNILRPNEGDLIYIPLSDSMMEIKYVENRKPFYQLQKNYVYQLNCELFEYEDEEIKTGITELDDNFKDIGYAATLTLSGIGSTATAYTDLVSGGIQYVNVVSGGYKYFSAPKIIAGSPQSGIQASLVGVMTGSKGLVSSLSLKKVYIENPGTGYSSSNPPTISYFGGGGYGIDVRVGIATSGSVGVVTLSSFGQGYYQPPTVTFSSPVGSGITATGEAVLNSVGGISTIRIINAGYGYTQPPVITIGGGTTVSIGNFIFGETVNGSISNAVGTVKQWNPTSNELIVSGFGTDFIVGDLVIGQSSNAAYRIRKSGTYESIDSYDTNEEIQEESDQIIDFNEINPFGEV